MWKIYFFGREDVDPSVLKSALQIDDRVTKGCFVSYYHYYLKIYEIVSSPVQLLRAK